MKYLKSAILFHVFFFVASSVGWAGVTIPWSTTFDCPDWKTYSATLNCDGIGKGGDWGTVSGHSTQIVAAGNHAAGDGGKGLSSWIGDGTNNNPGGVSISFPNTNEIYVRWYQRYEAGFTWSSLIYTKTLYFNIGGDSSFNTGFHGTDRWQFEIYSDSPQVNDLPAGSGWNTVHAAGNSSGSFRGSDGLWHCYEIHAKRQTSGANGVIELWIDGEYKGGSFNRRFRGSGGFNSFLIPSNQKTPNNGRDMAVDFDDIAISHSYIGPLVTGPSPNPSIHLLLTTKTGTGDGTLVSSPSGINCGSTCSADIADSVSEEITAIPDGNSQFDSWVGCSSVNGNVCTVDMTSAKSVTASFSSTSSVPPPSTGEILFTEDFEDTNLSSRGWYDNTSLTLSSTEFASTGGSTKSAEFYFASNATTPTSGGAIRKKFTATDDVTVEFWVKYSSNWQGSGETYHPHEILIGSDMEPDYTSIAYNNLMLYIEESGLTPRLQIQDGKNVNTSYGALPQDLVGVTEDRAVGGCNGDSDGLRDGRDCYGAGPSYNSAWFDHDSAAITAGSWHKVKVRFKLNSISNGVGQKDGIMQYWLDDNLLIDYHTIVYRTNKNPNIKLNQFIIAPYIGDGSPVAQTMWIDNLEVAIPSTTNLPRIPLLFQNITSQN